MTSAAAPAVDVVIATRDRPDMLRRALAAVDAQDYPGRICTTVVFDRSLVDEGLIRDTPQRSVRVTTNLRKPGLAGARNTGILQGESPFVAFCDDDDEWLPGKLSTQVSALAEESVAVLACTGITVVREGVRTTRLLQRTRVSHSELLRSRLTELHPSTFLLRRRALEGALGLVEEQVPHGYGEDYDLLLRAAALSPVVNVPVAQCLVHWHAQSYYAQRWVAIAEGLEWLLQRHPEIRDDHVGLGRVAGQIAFANAAAGRRRIGLAWAWHTWRAHPAQPRAYLAVLVAVGVLPADMVVGWLNRRGRGV